MSLSKEARIFVDSVIMELVEIYGDSESDDIFKSKLETRIEAFESELVAQTERRFIEALQREAKI